MRAAVPRGRLILLSLAAAGLAALASVGPDREGAGEAVAAARRSGPAPAPSAPAVPAAPDALDPGRAFRVPGGDRKMANAFGSRDWRPPPPPPQPAGPPPKPVAPPLPFTFLGLMEMDDTDTPTLVLRKGEDILLVKPSESFDLYRLDELAADRAVITYLPLQERQVLNLKAAR